MPLPLLRGHDEVRSRLARAVAAGTLAQSILLHGPRGVGKERLGLWLAQLLVCDAPDPSGPCGTCRPCRLAMRLEHPDVHWFFPLPRPDASSNERLREKLEDARAAELALRRDDPAHVPRFDKAPAIFLAAVQRIHQLASVKPAMGARKVFVVGDAELMVPQESSPEAANAFLKLLEEPPADTTVIITTSQPGVLLPTILSRVLAMRVAPAGEEAVRAFLAEELEVEEEEATRIARVSRGSVGGALRLLGDGDTPGGTRAAARELLIAALASTETNRYVAATGQKPFGGRGEFTEVLEALGEWLRDLMAVSAGASHEVADPASIQLLERAVARRGVGPLGAAAGLERVARAQELAQGNVNPQLIVADLLRGLSDDLVAAPDGVTR